jgi:hypothetical protein
VIYRNGAGPDGEVLRTLGCTIRALPNSGSHEPALVLAAVKPPGLDATLRRSFFFALDRASRWVFGAIPGGNKTEIATVHSQGQGQGQGQDRLRQYMRGRIDNSNTQNCSVKYLFLRQLIVTLPTAIPQNYIFAGPL